MNLPLEALPEKIAEESMSKNLVNEISALIPNYASSTYKTQTDYDGDR